MASSDSSARLSWLQSLVALAKTWGQSELDDDDRVEGHHNEPEPEPKAQPEPEPEPDPEPEPESESDPPGMAYIASYLSVIAIPPGYAKARSQPRPLAQVDAIVVHQSAVLGGFGVSEALAAKFDGDLLTARQVRYRDTPYHGIYSPRDRASIIQWPAWAHTYHGHGANAYSVGWAYDGKFPGDTLDLVGARASFRHFVLTLREAGVDLRYVETHRQHSSSRAADPGPEIWAGVIVPLLAELGLEERPVFTTGSGLATPEDWH